MKFEFLMNNENQDKIEINFKSLDEFKNFIESTKSEIKINENFDYVEKFIENQRISHLMEHTYECKSKDELNKVILKILNEKYLGKVYSIGGEEVPEMSLVDANYYSYPNGKFKFREKNYKSINELINDKSNAYKGNKFGKSKLAKGVYAVHHYWDLTLEEFEDLYKNPENRLVHIFLNPSEIKDVDHTFGLISLYRQNYLDLFGVDENHIRFDYEVIHYPDDKDARMFIRYGLDVLQLKLN